MGSILRNYLWRRTIGRHLKLALDRSVVPTVDLISRYPDFGFTQIRANEALMIEQGISRLNAGRSLGRLSRCPRPRRACFPTMPFHSSIWVGLKRNNFEQIELVLKV